MWFSTEEVVGLDIGSSSIKAVQLNKSPKYLFLKTLGIQGLPPLAIQQDEIVYPEPVVSSIVHLYQKYNIKNKNVALALTGPSVSVKKITIAISPVKNFHSIFVSSSPFFSSSCIYLIKRTLIFLSLSRSVNTDDLTKLLWYLA